MTQPITLQPGLQNFTPGKTSILKDNTFSKSLECLCHLESVTIRQDLINDLQGGCGSPNTYNIFGNSGQTLFHVVESSSCLCRWCCGPSRQFQMDLYLPNQSEPVLYFKRPLCHCEGLCCFGCCCCANKILVYDLNGLYLGKASDSFSFFGEKFNVKNRNEEIVARIKTSCLPCRCSGNIKFQTFGKHEIKNLGVIEKKWMGNHSSGISFDHETFSLTFPLNLDVDIKALLIGAAFLLNVVYFEMS